jgi:hypothetical protein
MVKKIILSTLFVALCGFLLYGAIHRTIAKTDADAGRENEREREQTTDTARDLTGEGRGSTANSTTTTGDLAWRTIETTVVSVSETDMVLADASGAEVLVEGRPWSYAVQRGFSAQPGDVISLAGYDENGEFKTGVLDNKTTGQQIELRRTDGSPAWAGSGGGSGSGS